MNYHRLLVLIAVALVALVAGCGPNYTSGKTQCSDKKECPSGYSCSDDGTNATHYCVDNKTIVGAGGAGGTGGTGGSKTTVVGMGGISGGGGIIGTAGDAGVIRDASVVRDVYTADLARDLGRDAVTSCPILCLTGQQCYSGQCCKPPAAGGNCTAYPSCGCPSGQVCYPSLTTQSMVCFAANNIAEGADCTGGLLCQAGLGCFGGICKRYCSTFSDCPSVGGVQSCDQTVWSSDKTNILGVLVCERICDPARPQSPTAPLLACPTGFNCTSDTGGASYCFKASPLPAGSTCSGEVDCPAGSYCTTSGTCTRYCLSNSDCASGATCQFTWSPPEYAGAYLVGYCK